MSIVGMAVAPGPTHAAGARAGLLDRVETRLHDLLAAELSPSSGVDLAAVPPGGERLRPAFCVSGFLAAGGDPDREQVAVDAAAALEVLQVLARLHDDVPDDSEPRDGLPAAAGDLAHIHADRLVGALNPAAREIWHELRIEIMIGRYLDVHTAAERIADPQLSRWIAVCGSGRYTVRRPLALGAAIAGRRDLTAPFERYGTALGEACRLRDDLRDAFGDRTGSVRTAGPDVARRKMTMLTALVMPRDERITRLLAGAGGVTLGEIAGDLDVRGEIERRIGHLVEQAQDAVATAPLDSGWRDELARVAVQVAYRR
jgi:geranylgeranyl diphosphate synthase type I